MGVWPQMARYQRGIRNLLLLGVYCLPGISWEASFVCFFLALFVMHGHVGNFFYFCNIVYNFAILSNVVSMFQVLPSLSILT